MKNLKRSVITRGIDKIRVNTLHNLTHTPRSGDVAVFEVVSLGKHQTIQSVDETRVEIFPGDYILMAFGGCCASHQFEGYVPDKPQTELQILGQGGVVGVLAGTHRRVKDIGATQVRLVGYAVDIKGEVVNTRYQRTEKVSFVPKAIKNYAVYLSVGTGMDSGKTTTAAYFARGAMLSGKRVAYIKLTGTACSNDKRTVRNSGATTAVDFSHCGYPSTYMCSTEEILDIYATLLKRVESSQPDIVVVEVADGLLQKETNELLNNSAFMQGINGVILSCADSLSAYGGLQILQSIGIEPMIMSGVFTASPLMMAEVADFTDTIVLSLDDFAHERQLLEVLLQCYGESNACLPRAKDHDTQTIPQYISDQYIPAVCAA